MDLDRITKTYSNGETPVYALKDVTFDFPDSGLVILTGKSGCGKSTLLYSMAGIISLDSGKIYNEGIEISSFSEKQWDDYRNKTIGFVFQDFKLLNDKTVEENLEIALDIQKIQDHAKRIKSALAFVDLEEYGKRKAYELSAGQKQRVAIARAIVKNSEIILADEPTGNLDENNSEKIWDLLKRLSADHLIVAVTHDPKTASKYADLVLKMSDGRICESYVPVVEGAESIIVDVAGAKRQFAKGSHQALFEYLLSLCGKEKETVTISREYIPVALEKKRKTRTKEQNRIKSLPLKTCASFAGSLIKKRFMRHLLTSVIFAISLLFAYSAVMLIRFSYGEAISRYVKDSGTKYLELRKYTEFRDGFERDHSKYLGKGKALYDVLEKSFGEECIVRVMKGNTLSNIDGRIAENISVFYAINMPEFDIVGRFPSSKNEIAITDYLSNQLGANKELEIGKTLLVNGEELTISGIIHTDYREYGILSRIVSQNLSDTARFKLDNEYLIACRSIDCLNDDYYSIPCEASNFFLVDREIGYLESYLNYSSNENVRTVLGRIPEAENEIVISYSLYKRYLENDENPDAFVPVEVRFLNIQSDKYNDYYSDILNLYDIMPKSNVVVGVVEDSDDEDSVYIHPSLFEKLEEVYKKYYSYDCLYVRTYGNKTGLADVIEDNQLYWDEPLSEEMQRIANGIGAMKVFVVIAFLTTLISAAAMMINCVSYSIKDSAPCVGIMRALGVRRCSTFAIFIFEMLCVLAVSCILSNMLIGFLVGYINDFVNASRTEGFYRLFTVKGSWLGIMDITVIMSGFLAAGIPILGFSRKKVCELIRIT